MQGTDTAILNQPRIGYQQFLCWFIRRGQPFFYIKLINSFGMRHDCLLLISGKIGIEEIEKRFCFYPDFLEFLFRIGECGNRSPDTER